MNYRGDVAVGATFAIPFDTVDATGAPVTLGGTPAVRARKSSGTSTAGLTLTVDVVTGQHRIDVDLTADSAFYAAGSDVWLELSAGTIDGVSQAGKLLASFSVQNRYVLTAAAIRSALGLASANVDVQLAAIAGYLDTEMAAALAAALAIRTVTDQLIAAQPEPTSAPAANATPLEKLAWMAMLVRNEIRQTSATQSVRNDANNTNVATASVSDDGTTTTRGEWS